MNIELHVPHGKVPEKVINSIKKELVSLHHKDKEISRAEVHFKDRMGQSQNKSCEIHLTIFGSSLYVQRHAASYEKAANQALNVVSQKIDEQVRRQKDLPDVITTTVKV